MLKPFLIALQFLTRLPVPQSLLGSEIASDRQLGLSVLMYPLVGLVIGGMLILFPWLVQEFNYQVDAQIMAAIVLFVWVLITGALHLDGLSDSADAWVGGFGDKTRTLEIMKDPYSGPAGVSIIVIVLIAKFAALITIVAMPVMPLLLIPVLARTAVIALFLTTPYVRKEGIGAKHIAAMPKLGGMLVLLLVIAACGWLFQLAALWLILALVAVFILLRLLMQRRIGGTTGDTAGALIEVMEMVGLLVIAVIF